MPNDDMPGPHRLPKSLRDLHARNKARMQGSRAVPVDPQWEGDGEHGRLTQTAWHDHALHFAAAELAYRHSRNPDQFKGRRCTYGDYRLKTLLHRQTAAAVKKSLSRPSVAIVRQKLDRISEGSVRQFFLRSRAALEKLVAEKAAEIARSDEWTESDEAEILAEIEKGWL